MSRGAVSAVELLTILQVLIARTDGENLALQDLEWFGDWCCQDLMPYFQDAAEGLLARQAVLDQITPAAWQEYRRNRIDHPRPASLTIRDHENDNWD